MFQKGPFSGEAPQGLAKGQRRMVKTAVKAWRPLFFLLRKKVLMKRKAHLLIVEDNPDHQELFFDALAADYQLTFSANPGECLARLRELEVDLILLDYYLQNEYSGLKLLETITTRYPQIPVIFVTAHGDEEVAASAIKIGAVNYFRKSLEYDYLKAISQNIRELLSQASEASSAQTGIASFLSSHRDEFIKLWQQKITSYQLIFKIKLNTVISQGIWTKLVAALLTDLEKNESEEMLSLYKNMLWSSPRQPNTLLFIELLNLSCREAARELLSRHFPHHPPVQTAQLERLCSLIDYNDLKLSKEYEYVVGESTANMLRMERITTKLMLMRTLQHEIRQPLTYIFNACELILHEVKGTENTSILNNILTQAQKIEKLLSQLEKDSETPLKDYSDKLPMFDISSKGEEGNV